MRPLFLLCLAALSGISVLTSAAAAADDGITVKYTYRGAGSLAGDIQGTCNAYGAIISDHPELQISARGISMLRATTWFNQTRLLPGQPEEAAVTSPTDYARSVQEIPMKDDTYAIRAGPNSLIAFRPIAHPQDGPPSMTARFQGVNAAWSSVAEGATVAQHFYDYDRPAGPQTFFNGLGIHGGAYPDGARALFLQKLNATLEGATVLHLRDVSLLGGGQETEIGPYALETENRTAPGGTARIITTRLHEVFLAIEHVTLTVHGPEATLVCGEMDVRMNGHLTVFQASGNASTADNQLAFDDRVLEIDGEFDVLDAASAAARGGTAHATATGDITVVGLDFGAAGELAILDDLATRVGVGLAVAALLAILAKTSSPTLTVLFTRLRDEDVRDHPLRKRILRTLNEQTVVERVALAAQLNVSRTNLRHHIEVLIRAGLARTISIRGQTLLASLSTPRDLVVGNYIAHDPRLHAVETAFASGLHRAEVVKRLADQFDVTNRTARKYVETYVQCRAMGGEEASP